MIYMSDFDQIVKEYFDLSDSHTRKYIVSLDEADQGQLLAALSTALYEKIVAKVDKIDFGTIPKSRGDITKVDGFAQTIECLDIIRRLSIEYKQATDIVDVVINAANNVKDRKVTFTRGFNMNANLVTTMYNLITLSIERSVSYMIATCIQYIKDPNSETMKIALNKVAYNNAEDDVIYQQLISFNKMCQTKEIDKVLENALKNGGSIAEDVTITISADDSEINFKGEAPASYEEKPCDNCEDKPVVVVGSDGEERPELEAPADEAPEEDIFGADDDVAADNIPAVTPQDPNAVPAGSIHELEDKEGCECGMDEATLGDVVDAVLNNDNVQKLIKNDKVRGAVKIAATVAAGGIAIHAFYKVVLKNIIPFLRNMAYNFYYSKAKLSDDLAIQAQLIEANAIELENSSSTDIPEEKKKKIVEKQKKTAEFLRKWSNRLSIDRKTAEKQAEKQTNDDENDKSTVGTDDDGDESIF